MVHNREFHSSHTTHVVLSIDHQALRSNKGVLLCTWDYLGNQVVTLSEEQLVDVGPRTSLESWRESPPEVLVVLLDISDGDRESPHIFCKYFFYSLFT